MMTLWNPDETPAGPRSLSDLELGSDLIHRTLFAAVTDAQLCSSFDSPTAAGIILWTRINRYLREELAPRKWTISNSNLILRTIHPSGAFAITAVSANGGVGNLSQGVRTRNPKGDATARLVAENGTIPFTFGDETIDSISDGPDEAIPTWFLLYNWNRRSISSELSYPVSMTGPFVTDWRVRIPIAELKLDDVVPSPWDDDDAGPDFDIEEK